MCRTSKFFRIKTPQTFSVPTFALNNISKFDVYRSEPVADTYLDYVDEKRLWKFLNCGNLIDDD
jgi:hypothetical protein